MKYVLTLLLTLTLLGCGSKQVQETTQEVQATNATLESSQDATQGTHVDGDADTVVTEHNTGISPLWFIGGTFFLGLFLPRPKFIKALF